MIGILPPYYALAHPTLSDSIRHTKALTIGPKYIDATVELTFLGAHAQIKRRELDINKNGHIESTEIKAHAQTLLSKAKKHIKLKQDQDSLKLINLYDPEVIVGSTRDISTNPVTIRFTYFTHTPKSSSKQNILTLHDTLYAGIQGNYRFSIATTDDFHAKLISQTMVSHTPNSKRQPPHLKAEVTSLKHPTEPLSTSTEASHE